MHAVKRASFSILFFALLFSCKPRLDVSSTFDDIPAGIDVEYDSVNPDVKRMVEIGLSNNFSFTEANLDAAIRGGTGVNTKAVLKTVSIYRTVENQRQMVGYILYQIVDSRYIILADMALDQTLPEADLKSLEPVLKREIVQINESSKLPILQTIFSAHSRKTDLLQRVGFQEIREIGNQTVTSGATETGDMRYLDSYYRFGDAKKDIIEAFADSYQTTALLNKNKIVTDNPELRDRLRRGFLDLREYYRAYPEKKKDPINRRDIEDNILRSLLKKEIGSYILLGDKGGGKSFNLDLIVAKLARGQYPELLNVLKNFEILQVDASELMANTTYRGQLEAKIKALRDRSKDRAIIIYADEVHRLAGLGKSDSGGGSDLFENLKEGMADGSIRLIGSTTPQEYYDTFSGRDAVVDRLFIDTFGYLDPSEVKGIVDYHLKKRGVTAPTQQVIDAIYLFSERFEPNGGQVRAKVKFIDDLMASRDLLITRGQLQPGTPITVADIVAEARRYYSIGDLVIPEQRQAFLSSLASRTGSDAIDQSLLESVYAGLADNSSKQITTIQGPEGSGRSYASESIAKVLKRPHVEISLLPFRDPSQFPELMARIVSELEKKGTSHMVFAFTNAETAHPDVQRQLLDMFQKGVIVAKVWDANTRTSSTRKIKVPNILGHFIVPSLEQAAILANASPVKVKLQTRSPDTYAGMVRAQLKKIMADPEFKDLKLTEAEISSFVAKYVDQNYEAGKPFDADLAKIQSELRKIADGRAMGDAAPAFIKAACDALNSARQKRLF